MHFFSLGQNIMRNLVRRYVTSTQRQADNQGVTEDDVNEIKQDISAFRCELLEVLKNSGMNTASVSGSGTGTQHYTACIFHHVNIGRFCIHIIICYVNNRLWRKEKSSKGATTYERI